MFLDGKWLFENVISFLVGGEGVFTDLPKNKIKFKFTHKSTYYIVYLVSDEFFSDLPILSFP